MVSMAEEWFDEAFTVLAIIAVGLLFGIADPTPPADTTPQTTEAAR